MTNQTLVPRAHFVANGVQAAFGFFFPIHQSGDMEVWIDQNLQPAEAYAVSGVGGAVGGTVIFTVPPPAGAQVTLRRRMAINRMPEFPDTSVQAKPLNQEFGYHVAALQQVADEAGLAVKRSFRSLSTADLTLPEPSAGRAIRWNDSGDGLANSTAEVDTVLPLASAKAQDAAASAAAAAASQVSAAASAAAAATSRDICDADVVVTGADRAAVAADKTDVAADRTAVQADRLAADAAAAAAALSQGAAQASAAAALQAQANAFASETGAAVNIAAAQAAASAAAASQASAHASELSASGSASAAAASAAQAQSAAGLFTFASVAVTGQGTISADQSADTLTLAAGANLSITTDPASDTVTLAVTGLAGVAASGAYGDLSGRPSLGTAAALDTGVSAGQIPVLDATGLPALNASRLTSLNASNLSSGVVPVARMGTGSADAAKFLRGDGVWAALPSPSAYEFVQAVSFSGVTQFDIINLAVGYDYEFAFDDLVGGAYDGLYARLGTNNTTFSSSGYYTQYVGGQSNPNAAAPSWGSGSASAEAGIFAGVFNAEAGVSSWCRFFVNDVGASRYKHYGAKSLWQNPSNTYVCGHNMEGYWRNASAITAVRFYSSGGNTMTGTCLVYRRKRS
ncbi:hypothetical protein WV31_11300 [Magnetospirillum sp. ME-1]|uniref:hypothetical protein n=1 Tax=Magnetospirillum sp. ME-1 TaxID=1639348 RepID=UPI000A17EF34|nr:hypothetical protein [Magnetospirillum sp. ME-1]ARJ66202.1 hypothetical protein WV31_11300 [Magnetospirillum sp. ME-1]